MSPLLHGIFFEEVMVSDWWAHEIPSLPVGEALCRRRPPTALLLLPAAPAPALLHLQIGHAGDGGLYAELVQDRSFDALAKISNFSGSSDASVDGRGASAWPHRLPISLPALAAQQAGAASRRASCVGTSMQELRRRGAAACGSGNDDIILAWHALPGGTSLGCSAELEARTGGRGMVAGLVAPAAPLWSLCPPTDSLCHCCTSPAAALAPAQAPTQPSPASSP